MFLFLCRVYFTNYNVLTSIQMVAHHRTTFSFCLNSIPWCICSTISLSVCQWLGWFRTLAIVGIAAVHIDLRSKFISFGYIDKLLLDVWALWEAESRKWVDPRFQIQECWSIDVLQSPLSGAVLDLKLYDKGEEKQQNSPKVKASCPREEWKCESFLADAIS